MVDRLDVLLLLLLTFVKTPTAPPSIHRPPPLHGTGSSRFILLFFFSTSLGGFLLWGGTAAHGATISSSLPPHEENGGYSSSAVCRSVGYPYAPPPSFPSFGFAAQPDPSKVYLRVDPLAPPPPPPPLRTTTSSSSSSSRGTLPDVWKEAGLAKFATAFGIRVVGDALVPDDKITYVTLLLAELIDVRQDGTPTNIALVQSLRESHSMIVLVSAQALFQRLTQRPLRPRELKCFPRAFHLARHHDIHIHDQSREINCPYDLGRKDRTKGLIGDFLVSKGYPATYPINEEIGVRMKQLYETAKKNNWINTRASHCQTTVCLEIAFQSWAVSSALGSDKCWCIAAKEWKFCTPEEMRRGFPELWGTLTQELMLDGVMQPDGQYQTNAVVT